MYVSASGQNYPHISPNHPEQRPEITARTGSELPLGNDTEHVDISEAGQTRLDEELQRLEKGAETHELFDLRSPEGRYRLGLIALGTATIEEWQAKGLEVSEEAILAAADAFQAGLRQDIEQNGSSTAGTYVALNRHQIVKNYQDVPDWFMREHEMSLSLIDNESMRSAFENGATYFVGEASAVKEKQLSRYIGLAGEA